MTATAENRPLIDGRNLTPLLVGPLLGVVDRGPWLEVESGRERVLKVEDWAEIRRLAMSCANSRGTRPTNKSAGAKGRELSTVSRGLSGPLREEEGVSSPPDRGGRDGCLG
jgi:hypothetical protein